MGSSVFAASATSTSEGLCGVVSFFRVVNECGTVFGPERAAAERTDVVIADGAVEADLAVDQGEVAQHLVESEVHRLVHDVQFAEERVGFELVLDLFDLAGGRGCGLQGFDLSRGTPLRPLWASRPEAAGP